MTTQEKLFEAVSAYARAGEKHKKAQEAYSLAYWTHVITPDLQEKLDGYWEQHKNGLVPSCMKKSPHLPRWIIMSDEERHYHLRREVFNEAGRPLPKSFPGSENYLEELNRCNSKLKPAWGRAVVALARLARMGVEHPILIDDRLGKSDRSDLFGTYGNAEMTYNGILFLQSRPVWGKKTGLISIENGESYFRAKKKLNKGVE